MHHVQVTEWLRYYSDEDDVVSYYELDDDGWALRQADLQGPDKRPTTAATLDEVLSIRDTGGIAAIRVYEAKYGVLAETSLSGWREIDGVVETTAAEFEQVWMSARHPLERRP